MVHIVLKDEYAGKVEKVKAELQELCHRELSEYAQPVGFRVQEELPLTPIGKVDYRALEKDVAQIEQQ